MSDSPACESLLVMCSRILMSSIRYAGNSFLPVYQLDFQSWMTPTRIPPGWTFWPITLRPLLLLRGTLGRGLLLRALQRSSSSRRALRLRASATSAGAASSTAGAAHRRSLNERDGDVARALANPGDPAARARAPALHHRTAVDVRRLDVQPVLGDAVICLGVRDRGLQHLLQHSCGLTRGEGEDRPRLGHAAAADVLRDEPRLAR